MINNLTMFYKIVAIIETVLLVIASIVGAKIYSQNTILHSNFSIDNTGTIKTIKKCSLDEALLYQTNYDEVEKIKGLPNDYTAYKIVLTIENKSSLSKQCDRIDWFVLPGTKCKSFPLTDYRAVGTPTLGEALLSVYHKEYPEALSSGEKEYTLYLIYKTANQEDKEIWDKLDSLEINIQTELYFDDSDSPTFTVMTPITWDISDEKNHSSLKK